MAKPSNLTYAARDGVYASFLPGKEPAMALHNFVETHLSWSDEGGPADFRLLDTFLSDAMSLHLLSKIVHQLKTRGGSLKVLLAAPDSAFGCARGASIQCDPLHELTTGVRNLRRALRDHGVLARGDEQAAHNESLTDIVASLSELAGSDSLAIPIRFYRDPPSSPMFFFDDYLITSRFAYGSSSIANPWQLVVNDDRLDDDLYSSYSKEFELMWAKATPEAMASPAPTLTKQEEHRATVLAVRIGANITERALYAYTSALAPLWEAVGSSYAVRKAEREVIVTPLTDGVVVAFLNPDHTLLPLDLAKELFSRYGLEMDLRYAVVRGGLVLVQTGPFTQHAVGAPNDLTASLSRRVDSQCVALSEQYLHDYVHEPERWGELDSTIQVATDLLGHALQYRVLHLRANRL